MHCQVNGHDFHEIENAFKNINSITGKPHVIIAHTIKGKGISFMEDDNNWHYRTPNKEELENALKKYNSIDSSI